MTESDWNKCYSAGWGDLIVPDAYAHPAKYSRALIQRIYQHAREEGWLTAGSTVVDPFGGVALGGFDAAWNGCHWVGVELEPKFVELGSGSDCGGFTKADWRRLKGRAPRLNFSGEYHWCPTCLTRMKVGSSRLIPQALAHHYQGNIVRWQERYGHMPGWGSVRLVQGDSRQLGEVVREAGLCVSSPPFASSLAGNQSESGVLGQMQRGENKTSGGRFGKSLDGDYGSTPGQLGALPATDKGFDAAVGSPPFAESLAGGKNHKGVVPPHDTTGFTFRDYGQSDGQLGAMRDRARGFDQCVSSPPFERSDAINNTFAGREAGKARWSGGNDSAERLKGDYEKMADLGSGDDFWTAARTILGQTYSVLRPGAHACWVVKSFVRNKRIVDFPDQWRRLCESVGFRTLHLHRAWLVEVNGHQARLDGEEADRVGVERKSFFRRLAESKGSPRIDYEVVLCMERPSEPEHGPYVCPWVVRCSVEDGNRPEGWHCHQCVEARTDAEKMKHQPLTS